mgnify:CR=1 FL=1|jgi:hypothetical protein
MSTIVTLNRGAQGPPTLADTDKVVIFEDFNGVAQSTFTSSQFVIAGGVMTNSDGSTASTLLGSMITPEFADKVEISFLFRAKLTAHNSDTEFDCGYADAAGTAASASHTFAIALNCGSEPKLDVVTCYLDDNDGDRSEKAVTLSEVAGLENWDPAQYFMFGGTLKRNGDQYVAKYYVDGVLIAKIVDSVPSSLTGTFDAQRMGLFATQAAGTGLASIDYAYGELPRA